MCLDMWIFVVAVLLFSFLLISLLREERQLHFERKLVLHCYNLNCVFLSIVYIKLSIDCEIIFGFALCVFL